MLGRGNKVNPKIIMIGEAPGPDEAKQGVPFIGRAGKKLDTMIRPALTNNIVYITNCVKCYPPVSTKHPLKGFRVPKKEEVDYCYPNLKEELDNLKGDAVIMTLGSVALFSLIGVHKGILKELGTPRQVKISQKTYTIIPNYHPSYVMRSSKKNEGAFRKVFEEVYEHHIL